MEYESAALQPIALPGLCDREPRRETPSRPSPGALTLLQERASVLRESSWEEASWVVLLASTLVAIGLSFLG